MGEVPNFNEHLDQGLPAHSSVKTFNPPGQSAVPHEMVGHSGGGHRTVSCDACCVNLEF